jgi:hypothetical protein
MHQPFPFDKRRVPSLSITGSENYPAVQCIDGTNAVRMVVFYPLSAQREISSAAHYHNDNEIELVEPPSIQKRCTYTGTRTTLSQRVILPV